MAEWTLGTIREVCPKSTLERIIPIAKEIGVTRVGNITGLDQVGVPVWIAVRPLAKSLTVSQGKGLTHELAQCSGIMESIELYHAETTVPDGLRLGLTAYAHDKRFVNPARLALHRNADFTDDRTVYWARGIDIASGTERWIPHELFNLDFTRVKSNPPLFIASSNGLASGNSYTEAILHGLCEVVERDQLSFWLIKDKMSSRAPKTTLSLESIDDSDCRKLIDRCKLAGLEIVVWYATTNIALPVFVCVVADHLGRTLYRHRAAGSGCHPLKAIALSRAITEALQSRLTHISGVRDDVDWRKYREGIPCTAESAEWLRKVQTREEVTFSAIPDAKQDESLSSLLEYVKRALFASSLSEVIVVDLTSARFGLPVIFVCVPDLEFSALQGAYFPGKRMLDTAREDA